VRVFKKIKASALQYTLLVSVVVAILIGSFLTLTHIHSLFGIQSQQLLQVVDVSNQGIYYGLQNDASIQDSISIPFENSTTVLSKSTWGGFSLLKSKAVIKQKQFIKTALVGMEKSTTRDAIYLTETIQPLVLVGDAEIQGDTYLSDRGIKAGVINGNYFTGQKLITGSVKQTSGILPQLDMMWRNDIEGWLRYTPSNKEVIPIQETQRNSFKEGTKFIYSPNSIKLGEQYTGNIVIKSETEITIEPYARLTDVFLIAPKVTVKKGFTGSVHLLAEETVTIEENVSLQYPSSIVLKQKDFQNIENPGISALILIGKNNSISGSILFLSKEQQKDDTKVAISIDEGTEILGQLYIEGNTELYGTVEGMVYSERFITNKFGSRYINHIYNGKILNRQLPESFCGLPLSTKRKGVAKWFY
jgi:hypothetical protein